MGSSAFEEPDHEGNFVDGGIDPDGFIRAMARLARSTTDTESIHLLLSSIRINQEDRRQRSKTNDKFQSSNRKRHSEEDRGAGDQDDGNKRARKDVDNAKSAKGKRLVRIEAFECENCERFFATEPALKTHKDSCAEATNAPKSKKYKCDLCNKERTNIYNHYATIHAVEYPEQIMFYGGHVLVRSDIDTKGGKAPWFKKEEEKATKKYDNLTCRLCETKTKFSNSVILADHYTMYHMVEPAKLDNMKHLFRAEKGAHLVDTTSQTPGKRKRATSNPTPDANSKYNKENTKFPCQLCKGKYSNKGNLARHVKSAHLGKKPAGVVAKKLVSNENKKEKNTSKPPDRREPKSEKSKCELCDKEHSAIYKHYGNIHNIEDPEQLLFENGNVLVLSSIDTKGGKAPWFLREAEKIKRYTSTTCRLCATEVQYDNPVLLENHYRSDHKVVPGALERLKYLFRAEKGAHLADLPASRTPCKQQKNTSPQRQGETVSRGLTENTDSYVSAAEHTKQISEREIEKQDASVRPTSGNVQSDSPIIQDSTPGSRLGNRQPIQILEDIVVSVFCNECNKSIMYSDFEAHAATHKHNQYELECIQRIDENAEQKQRCDKINNKGHQESVDILSQKDSLELEGNCGGIVESWNSDNDSCHSYRVASYVMQVDVHVERDEVEEINQTNQDKSGCRISSEDNGNKDTTDHATIEKTSENADLTHQGEHNSEINAVATHQVQDTEEQEEWELWQNLHKDLEKLLGPEEIDTHVDKSTPDKITNTQELQEILETDTTVQGTSVINNYREEHAVIQNKNNDSMKYSRDIADKNISQDIFTNASDPSEIHDENSAIRELSQDMFSGTTQENVNIDDLYKRNSNESAHIETTTENEHENSPNITRMENVGDTQPKPRPSKRDIVGTLLEGTPSDVNAATEEERRNEEESRIDQQCLVDETQRIKEIMFSRD